MTIENRPYGMYYVPMGYAIREIEIFRRICIYANRRRTRNAARTNGIESSATVTRRSSSFFFSPLFLFVVQVAIFFPVGTLIYWIDYVREAETWKTP